MNLSLKRGDQAQAPLAGFGSYGASRCGAFLHQALRVGVLPKAPDRQDRGENQRII
jgi:hypothetical protein